MSKKWILKPKYPQEFADKLPGFSSVVLQLLYDRGLDNHKKIDEFLNPDYTQDLHDPFLFKDIHKAIERIAQAIEKNEKILIHGDYDADGVTSSALIYTVLKKIGSTNVDVFIPHRSKDGYGINKKNISQFIKDKVDLVITVDCGITNIGEIKKLKDAGIDTIVTDHHLPGDKLPPAYAILDPYVKDEQYPFKKLAGVGVAFKLAQALLKSQKDNGDYEAFEKWLLDLVTVGTIGDVSPILGENRTLVKYGLMVLNKTMRQGLRELIHISSLSNGVDLNDDIPIGKDLYDLSVRNVAWQIVPRINAAGRIGHAREAFKLLVTEDEVEALVLAREIHQKNLSRQKISETLLQQVEQEVGEVDDEQKIIVIKMKGLEHGVIGLVAGRLKDKYYKPIIVLNDDGKKISGSGRSIPDFNITQALEECQDFLEQFGGHSQACGVTIVGQDNYKKFVDKINKLAQKKLKGVELVPSVEVDVEVNLKDLSWEVWDELEKFEPFAEANPMPLFLIKNVTIESVETMGKTNRHLRFQISQNRLSRKAVSFSTAEEWSDKIKSGDVVDLVVEFGINEWNGNRELQFKIIDFKK